MGPADRHGKAASARLLLVRSGGLEIEDETLAPVQEGHSGEVVRIVLLRVGRALLRWLLRRVRIAKARGMARRNSSLCLSAHT